jgi:two-component system response regulator AtoC
MEVEGTPVLSRSGHFVSGVSPAMRALERVIADIAPTDIPVLLVGESGTGKEAVALEIHRRSRQRSKPFVKCSCASMNLNSLPTNWPVQEGEPYGKASASGGTLFLDEISQLDPMNQTLLPQRLPDGDGVASVPYWGARLISATTRNLEHEMRGGRFSEALYYRINGVRLQLPSLRQRREDIPALLAFFLTKFASLFERPMPQLQPVTMDLLLEHTWPGNIRELENVARKFVVLGDEHLAVMDLAVCRPGPEVEPASELGIGDAVGNGTSLKEVSREASRKAERQLILKALERTCWNRKRTARDLKISYKALLYKLKQLELDRARDS